MAPLGFIVGVCQSPTRAPCLRGSWFHPASCMRSFWLQWHRPPKSLGRLPVLSPRTSEFPTIGNHSTGGALTLSAPPYPLLGGTGGFLVLKGPGFHPGPPLNFHFWSPVNLGASSAGVDYMGVQAGWGLAVYQVLCGLTLFEVPLVGGSQDFCGLMPTVRASLALRAIAPHSPALPCT